MEFGETALDDAVGTLLAHSTSVGSLRLRKGHVLTVADIEALRAAGFHSVAAARLEEDDIEENDAASRIAGLLRLSGIRIGEAATGRVNFYAENAGIFVVDRTLIDAINQIDSSVTIATLNPYVRVKEGQMAATIKIIPFATTPDVIAHVASLVSEKRAFQVQGFTGARVGLIQTVLPLLKPTVFEKTRQVVEARVRANHGTLTAELRTSHDSDNLSFAIGRLHEDNDIVLVFGASAVVDAADVIPSAILKAGGFVHHIGMPVDPGNLLILGELGGKPVIGAPGCARSPKENGFDWVFDRLTAGVRVTKGDIVRMGVGGLLMEVPLRPQLRNPVSRGEDRPRIAITLLAAGKSDGHGDKGVAETDADTMLSMRRLAEGALKAGTGCVIAVLGHMASQRAKALEGLDITIAMNESYESGFASSLQCALKHLPASSEGLMVILAGRTTPSPAQMERLATAFYQAGGQSVVRARSNGHRSNPVIIPRILFDDLHRLTGDVGARHIIERGDVPIIEVEIEDPA